ncbi:hypothetical protein BDZ89DRAFT_334682 [Hymenopellis radicata]|nr:hypothetical protein BDZ89DRAFT_334682 [Hymenopellis radicata]
MCPVPSHLRPGSCQEHDTIMAASATTGVHGVRTTNRLAERRQVFDSDPQETLATSTGATSSYVPPASTQVSRPLPLVSFHPWFGLGFEYPPAWPSHVHGGLPFDPARKRVFVEQPSSVSAAAPASTSIRSIEDTCKGRPHTCTCGARIRTIPIAPRTKWLLACTLKEDMIFRDRWNEYWMTRRSLSYDTKFDEE